MATEQKPGVLRSLLQTWPAEYNFLRPGYWFGQISARPLALFRILFGALLLKDALYHIPLAHDLYSDAGILPRSALLSGYARPDRFSLMDSFPAPWMALAFFSIWALVIVLLIVGYRTRLMSILNFVLVLSVHERDPLVLNGADTVMRMLAFWMMFMPLGEYYSVDALRRRFRRYQRSGAADDVRVEEAPRTAWAFPVRMIQLQIALVYLFTAVLKIPGAAWANGDAVNYSLQLQTLTSPVGDWFLGWSPHWLMALLDYFTLFAEWAFLFLVFAPYGQPAFRISGLIFAAMLHLGIAVLMTIPNFSAVLVISFILFFEGKWVERGDRLLRKASGPVVIPSSFGVHPLLPVLAITRPSEVALDQGHHDFRDADGWWAAAGGGERVEGVAAWRLVAGQLPLSRLWSWTLRSRGVRRSLWYAMRRLAERYPAVASSATAAAQPEAQRASSRVRWLQAPVAFGLSFVLANVVWYNLITVTRQGKPVVDKMPSAQTKFVDYLGLWQNWGMFAPFPRNFDGRIVIPGHFEDGTTLDLRTGDPLRKDLDRGAWGPNARWKSMDDRLSTPSTFPVLNRWASMNCVEYNTTRNLPKGRRLATLEIVFHFRHSHKPGEPQNPLEDQVLWKHYCLDEYKAQAGF
ncbi:MAG: HTTM domain-containing protein [Chloroflexi bacterium]|nr:HTTM domain-containing protein [Chloroflexota bacterium]